MGESRKGGRSKMRKEDWDVEFAAEILRRENEGQVTKPHQGRFDHKEKTKKTGENKSKPE
jgi:hypothetical protein